MKYNSSYIDNKSKRLIEWLTGALKDEELRPEEEDEWHKISSMDDFLRKYIERKKAIEAWRRKFPEVKSITTAYAYYHKTQVIIGTTHHANKQYHISLMVDVIDKAIKLCLDKEETKDLARLLEQRYRYLGVDREEEIDPNQIQRHIYMMTTDPKALKLEPPSKADFDKM